MSRNVCKWCGAEQQGEDDCGYQCASWRYRDKGIWIQSARCQQRCLEMRTEHEQTIEILKAREANTVEALRGHIEDLQRRIADAIDKAQRAIRFGLVANSSVTCVFASDMDLVIEILTGNSPELPDSSNSPANLESST